MRFTTESFGGGDTSWLGSNHGTDNARTSTFVAANFTPATHYPNGYLPSGTPVNVADEGDVKPWTDAPGEVLGFVLFDQQVPSGDAQFAIPVLRHGIIRQNQLPGGPVARTTGDASNFVFVDGQATTTTTTTAAATTTTTTGA